MVFVYCFTHCMRKGFTLIELILVVALTLFLTVATLQSVVGSTQQLRFVNSYEKVLEFIRQARSLAVSGKAQLDYTDYDFDTYTDLVKQPDGQADFVTPAYYGVHFEHYADNAIADKVILFADLHQKTGSTCKEKKYDPAPSSGTNANGCDIILETYELPARVKLLGLPAANVSIFYTPLLADVSFDTSLPYAPFFIYEVGQLGNVPRKNCQQIHQFSGIPEVVPESVAQYSTKCPDPS